MFCTLPISCQTLPLYRNVNISVLLAVAVIVGAVEAANSNIVFHAIVLAVPPCAISTDMIAPSTGLLGAEKVVFSVVT
mgnify:CR=1 FL=1